MTDDLPELRASDADRERTAEVLRDAVAEGRLEMDEFEERLDAVYKARTYGELAPLTRDLPAAGAAAPAPPAAVRAESAGERHWPSLIGGPPSSRGAFAFWSGFTRRGTWTVPRLFNAFAMMGGGELDLREARFEAREVVIRCYAVMGGINVVVPDDVNVQVGGLGIMGGFDDRATGDGTPGAPLVRVTGFALMGGVGVERKRRKGRKGQVERGSGKGGPSKLDKSVSDGRPAVEGGHGSGHGFGHGTSS